MNDLLKEDKVLVGKTIVLVEDDQLNAGLIIKKLESVGATVFHSTDGESGLSTIHERKPDLVILDIDTPVLNGYEVLETMKKRGLIHVSPVIMISNSGQGIEKERVIQLGASESFTKVNASMAEMLEKIKSIILTNQNSAGSPNQDSTVVTEKSNGEVPIEDKSDEGENKNKTMDIEPVRVLVVEDDVMLRDILATKFSNASMSAKFSSDGNGVADTIKDYRPDVVLLDLMLPGVSGTEVLRAIKSDEETKDVPVIVFSNKSEEDNKKEILDLGASSFHMKASTDLSDLINEIITLKEKTSSK